MQKPLILVTGSTGKTGTAVVERLRELDWPVRAVVRSLDDRSRRLESLGAEIVVADLYDYEQMRDAARGTKRAYFCPPVQPFMIQAANVFAIIAHEVGLDHIAQLSQWLASPAHPSIHTRQLWLVEKTFSMIPGVGHTVVNPGAFAEPWMMFLPVAANLGVFPNPAGEMSNPSPSNEDIAAVVAAVLIDPAPHVGKRYRPTSARNVSMEEIAAMIGETVGRKVKVQDLPIKMFFKAAKAMGIGGFEITNTQHYFEEGKRGTFGINAPTPGMDRLTRRQPEDMADIVRRYAAKPANKRSFGSKMREMRGMVSTMLTAPFNADRFDRDQGYPVPPKPQLAIDSAIWREEHVDQPGFVADIPPAAAANAAFSTLPRQKEIA